VRTVSMASCSRAGATFVGDTRGGSSGPGGALSRESEEGDAES
jgi:hypothetical protein